MDAIGFKFQNSELDEFLAPVGSERFFREFFGRQPLHLPGHAQRFKHLMSWDDLNGILCELTDSQHFRLLKEGKTVPKEKYLKQQQSWLAKVTLLNAGAINRELREGATIVVNQLERLHAPVSGMCRMLELALGNYIDVVLFASCRATPGFSTHWDHEDVFIIQVVGSKHWRLFENERRHPTREDRYAMAQPPSGNPYWEGDLHPGDVLYIPNGWWHDVVATDSPTLHISFGTEMPTGLDLAQHLVERLAEHEALRVNLPKSSRGPEREEYLTIFRRLIQLEVQKISLDDYIETRDRMAPARGRLSLPWSAMPDCTVLPVPRSAWVHWLPPRVSHIKVEGNKMTLEASGSTFAFSVDAKGVLEDLMASRKTQFSALCERHDAQITHDALERFVIELVSSGLVTIAEAELV